MDPLSISASIASLIAFTQVVLNAGYGAASGIRRFPDEIQNLLQEVTTLRGTLSALQIVAERLESESGAQSRK